MWKSIKNYKGYYRVSSNGKIKSVTRTVARAYRGPFMTIIGKVRSPSKSKDGYLQIKLWKDSKCQTRYVHHLVLETFIGPCPEGLQCLHLDDNPSNNKLSNLRWGTPAENCAQRDLRKSRSELTHH